MPIEFDQKKKIIILYENWATIELKCLVYFVEVRVYRLDVSKVNFKLSGYFMGILPRWDRMSHSVTDQTLSCF